MTGPFAPPRVGPYHPMIGPMLKMQRAQKHFEELQDTVKTFVGSNPYSIANDPDTKRGHYVARLKIERQPPPELSAIIGDAVHNMRSSLDHLVWLLIRTAGNDPEMGRPQFPMFTRDPFDRAAYANTNKWKNALSSWNNQTKGLAPVGVAIIKRMQPYKSTYDPALHPLARLNELSNWDKHRELHFVGQSVAVTGTRILEGVSPRAAVRPHWVLPKTEMLKDGMIVARFRGHRVPEGEPQVNTNLQLTFEIAFGEGSPLEGLRVIDALEEIGVQVSNVLLAFKLRFDGKL